jgi:hypothetical protein
MESVSNYDKEWIYLKNVYNEYIQYVYSHLVLTDDAFSALLSFAFVAFALLLSALAALALSVPITLVALAETLPDDFSFLAFGMLASFAALASTWIFSAFASTTLN